MIWGREKERDTVLDNIRLWCQLEHRSQRNYFAIRFAKFFNNIMWTCACKQVRNAQAYKWDLRLRGSIQCTVYLSFIISKIYRLLCTVNIIYLLHFSVLPPPPITYTVQNQCVSTRLKRCALCLYIDKWFYFPWALFADCVCVICNGKLCAGFIVSHFGSNWWLLIHLAMVRFPIEFELLI